MCENEYIWRKELKYLNPEYWIFNRVISDISVALREITLTIPDSIEIDSLFESDTVRVVSLCTAEITGIKRFKKNRSYGSGYFKLHYKLNQTNQSLTGPSL